MGRIETFRAAVAAAMCLLFTLVMPVCAEEILFNRDVRPILSDACFFCHGPDADHREADLRLDVEDEAKEHAIVAGSIDASELIQRIVSDDSDLLMPPPESGKKLTPQQISLLKQWVKQGAVYEAYWAYLEPKEFAVPDVNDPKWASDPIDRFVLFQLQKQQLKPSEDADSMTLIRRVTFDLTGLPPTIRQVEEFNRDARPGAFRRYVDRLLASPAYGERMAVYWLDLVRFADTVGYHGDQDHSITPYRDYVIESFNDNMPLDQFAREQIAGDLLPEPTTDQLIASGYNRLLQTSHEGGVQPKEYLAIYAADRIRNFSEVWMGATVGCAQCHDHKYDPYTAADFYSLSAFFADLDESQHFKNGTNSLPTKRFPEISVLPRWQRGVADSLSQQIAGLDSIDDRTNDQENRLAKLKARREQLAKNERLTMISKATTPRQVRVLPRGNWMDDTGPVVSPSTPRFMRPLLHRAGRADRLDLANWLTDSENGIAGLTARVFVNRFWYLLFGRGISPSMADFGGQGQPPTHPELLDRLSIDFVRSGWNVKRMIRRMVTSRTYQQSSVVDQTGMDNDPYNRWFARQARYRLPAEMVRDQALKVSGLMVSDVGGASVKPLQPVGYYRHLNFPKRVYVADSGAKQWRRGVYTHWQRQFLHPMLKAMDAPSREECTAQRPRSNTPLEALVLLNDPAMVEAAKCLAVRMMLVRGDDQDRLRAGFRLAVTRSPDADEMQVLSLALDSERKQYAAAPEEAERLLGGSERFQAYDSVELAAWTSVSRAMLNMYETVTRN